MSQIDHSKPIWRRRGFRELLLDAYHVDDRASAAITAPASSSSAFVMVKSRQSALSSLCHSLTFITHLMDAVFVGPLEKNFKRVAWDVQSSIRQCLSLTRDAMAIPGVSSPSGPSVEATFPFITSLSKQVRTMLPGQTHIIPGGWIDTETHRFHPALYLVSRNGSMDTSASYRFVVVSYPECGAPTTKPYHPKQFSATNMTVQLMSAVLFDDIPQDRLGHTAFWVALMRPLLFPGATFDDASGGPGGTMGNKLYDRLLPFLNRRPLEASVARSAALPVSWVSIPRNRADVSHIWCAWVAMRMAAWCCHRGSSEVGGSGGAGEGKEGRGGTSSVHDMADHLACEHVDELCLRMRWAAAELCRHQLQVNSDSATTGEAVAVQLVCQALGRHASACLRK